MSDGTDLPESTEAEKIPVGEVLASADSESKEGPETGASGEYTADSIKVLKGL